MLTLTSTERRALRARAHTLDPVVMIGQHGLTPAVLREIDQALNAHELIKVRIFNDERAEREALQLTICEKLVCARVQHLGKLILLWRPAPPKEMTARPKARPAKKITSKAAKKPQSAIDRKGQAVGHPLSARQARQMSTTTGSDMATPFAKTGRTSYTSRSTIAPTGRRARGQPVPEISAYESSPRPPHSKGYGTTSVQKIHARGNAPAPRTPRGKTAGGGTSRPAGRRRLKG